MIRLQGIADNRKYGKLYNFMEYKKVKPYFEKPMKITIGNPINGTYYMVKNLVYKGKQVLAMKQNMDSNTIILVEAKIEDGQLIHISTLSEEFLGDVSGLFKRTN